MFNFRKRKIFYRLFIPFSILGILLVIGFSSYIYFATKKSVEDRILTSKESYLVQTRNSLDYQLETIDYAFNSFSASAEFEKILRAPLTPKDFQIYRSLNTQLKYISSMGIEATQYTLISLEQKWQIANNSLSYLNEDEINQLREKYLGKNNRGLFWIPNDTGIQIVSTLPTFSKSKFALMFAEVPYQELKKLIEVPEQKSPVYVFNNDQELLYPPSDNHAESQKMITQTLEKLKVSDENSQEKMTIGGKKYAILSTRSKYNQWQYFLLVKPEEITQELRPTFYGLVVLTVGLIIMIILVAYKMAMNFVRPIRQLRRELPQLDSEGVRDDFDYIARSVDQLIAGKENLERSFAKDLPNLQTQFVLNLFRHRVTQQELDSKLESLKFPKRGQYYAVLLIQMDDIGQREKEGKDLFLLSISKMIEEIVSENARLAPIVLNDEMQATIFVFDTVDQKKIKRQLIQYTTEILQNVHQYLNISISMGVSSFYPNLLESKRACEMSKEALRYRLNVGTNSVIFYDEISSQIDESVFVHYPINLESDLFDAIRSGDEEPTKHHLYLLLAELYKQNQKPINFEISIIRFVNNLVQLGQTLGVDVITKNQNQDIYRQVLMTHSPEAIEKMLVEQLIEPMTYEIRHRTAEQFKTIAEKVVYIVQTEYDQDLSLDIVAERLHYSPTYLSKIFKKEYGMNFLEYLMQFRLQLAKQWLQETNMTIKEISEKLRYTNSQNFIRFFKKNVGMTPGEYRKENRD